MSTDAVIRALLAVAPVCLEGVVTALLALWALLVVQQAGCEDYRITGYSVTDFPGLTADGTSTTRALARGEAIAAGSWNLALGTYVDIAGLGVYRIADRGHLGVRHIDVLVSSRAEAYALTSTRTVCVVGGEE